MSSILTRKAEALSAQSVCHGARTNPDFDAGLTAQSGAVGGRSGEMVEACEPAAGTALPCQCCSERWLCVRPKRAVQEPFCHGPGAMRQVRTELPSCEQELLSALGQCWELE